MCAWFGLDSAGTTASLVGMNMFLWLKVIVVWLQDEFADAACLIRLD